MKTVTSVWIVFGSTGEYSDRREWMVEAHSTEEGAKKRIARLDLLMQEIGPQVDWYDYQRQEAAVRAMKEHPEGDPDFRQDYTGTSYYMGMCPLVSP
jgi:hypothetical protein